LRLGHEFGTQIGARSRLVFDDDGIGHLLGQALADRARDHVHGAAGGKRNDNPYRLRRVGLGQRGAWDQHRTQDHAQPSVDLQPTFGGATHC